MRDEKYYFHQTPEILCKDIIGKINWDINEIVLEPFAGENNFYNNIPEEIEKYRCEIEDGLCYKDFNYNEIKPTTILTNPPFHLDGKNAFYDIILFYSKIKSIKKMYILCNAICFESLTPNRMVKLNENKLFLNKLTTINIKKWRGRYFLLYFTRKINKNFDYYLGNY
tara:strand:+ start:1860 stop:2363 length:504 start_codon:yes stop_codon:yes gene_type:complete